MRKILVRLFSQAYPYYTTLWLLSGENRVKVWLKIKKVLLWEQDLRSFSLIFALAASTNPLMAWGQNLFDVREQPG
jgi:hypothetical protein